MKQITSLNCTEKHCKFKHFCANHQTAGAQRATYGFTPEITIQNNKIYCQTIDREAQPGIRETIPQNHLQLGRGCISQDKHGNLVKSDNPRDDIDMEEKSIICLQCNTEMLRIPGKYRAWQCSICQSKYRKVSEFQSHIERISLLDQMIAAEERPEVKKKLKKRVDDAEAYMKHCKEMKKKGLIWEDIEEWY